MLPEQMLCTESRIEWTIEMTQERDSESDGVRRKYKYRKLVMTQGVKIPARLAMKMVGPDCAYHLYSQHMQDDKDEQRSKG